MSGQDLQDYLASLVLSDQHLARVSGRYHGHDWRDMSHFLVHLTDDSGTLEAILDSMVIRPGTVELGFAGQQGLAAPAVSFSEIPPDDLARLVERQGAFGVAFHADDLTLAASSFETEFGRVWYVEQDTQLAKRLWWLAFETRTELDSGTPHALAKAFHSVAPLIDLPGDYGGIPRRFEWEREWRWVGQVPFAVHEVRFVLAPEAHHQALAGRWPGLPLVDSVWTRDGIEAVIGAHQPTSPSRGWNPMRSPASCRLWFDGAVWTSRAISLQREFDVLS